MNLIFSISGLTLASLTFVGFNLITVLIATESVSLFESSVNVIAEANTEEPPVYSEMVPPR